MTDQVTLLLDKSVHRYGVVPGSCSWGTYERDGPERGRAAAELLMSQPELAWHSIHTAVVAHNLEAVGAFLLEDRNLAQHCCEYDGWTPLLRLGFARLPVAEVGSKALAIARLLLEAGADSNASWTDGYNQFTVLVGVIGNGEGRQSAHPEAEKLARLLIAGGAEPFAPQALYNTSLGPDSPFWLEFLWNESARRRETGKWTGPAPAELGGEKCPSALDYLLGNAIPEHFERARWLLEHGADAGGVHFYSGEPHIQRALKAGRKDVVQLLVAHGALGS